MRTEPSEAVPAAAGIPAVFRGVTPQHPMPFRIVEQGAVIDPGSMTAPDDCTLRSRSCSVWWNCPGLWAAEPSARWPSAVVCIHGEAIRSPATRRVAAPKLPRLTTPMVRDNKESRAAPGIVGRSPRPGGGGLGAARDAPSPTEHDPTPSACSPARRPRTRSTISAQKFARMVMGSNNIDSCNRT